ncbi:hypothetical protein NNJEOMEG_03478 [Fundidesulfovibrio magnetotacticus]|uniref:Uncharacterized protein n=1 Tax=Fundidesulfovibrio magnetotacticus TaxID=2730080 RepID=A0A6V8LXK0_9BACT|nr:hypothetical protein [Fundidesulfovibrio magnetotacticus]GFK95610.1 hypothetical protein NNJEOMEG_03478 [Fundidesulfovibrio magnetotacticus]
MHRFPEPRLKLLSLPKARPTTAEMGRALVADPELGRFLCEPPGLPGWALPPGHAERREAASRRLVAWLESVDPLFGPTVNLLFDVVESWPAKAETAFWRVLMGNPAQLLDVYAEVRDLAEEELYPLGWSGQAGSLREGRQTQGGRHGR